MGPGRESRSGRVGAAASAEGEGMGIVGIPESHMMGRATFQQNAVSKSRHQKVAKDEDQFAAGRVAPHVRLRSAAVSEATVV